MWRSLPRPVPPATASFLASRYSPPKRRDWFSAYCIRADSGNRIGHRRQGAVFTFASLGLSSQNTVGDSLMIRLLGSPRTLCDGRTRREFLRIGGLTRFNRTDRLPSYAGQQSELLLREILLGTGDLQTVAKPELRHAS